MAKTLPEIKLFTEQEANRTLPFVRAVVEDIIRDYREIRDVMEGLRERPGDVALQDRVDSLKEELAGNAEELKRLGVELKSFEAGLVDFYHIRDDKLVFLCWKAGEDRISHWHDLESGFAGRRPL